MGAGDQGGVGNQETDGVGWDGEVEKLWKLGNYGDGWGGGATERGTTGGRGKRRTGATGCGEGRVAVIAEIMSEYRLQTIIACIWRAN